jgi:hypothetical protein
VFRVQCSVSSVGCELGGSGGGGVFAKTGGRDGVWWWGVKWKGRAALLRNWNSARLAWGAARGGIGRALGAGPTVAGYKGMPCFGPLWFRSFSERELLLDAP